MLYNALLFVHVFGALLMFVGIGLTVTAMISMLRSATGSQLREWSKLAVKADGLIPLSVLLIVVPGLYMTFTSWGWHHAWLNVSLVTLLAMTVMGPTINLRRLKAIQATANAAPAGALSESAIEKVRNTVLWTSVSIMTLLAVAIVFLMTVKPGLAGSLGTLTLALLGPLCSSALLKQSGKPAKTL